jgi:hypothetical protein
MTKAEFEKTFQETANGYGFEEIEQTPDGVFCEGCLTVHKRPTKMYSQYPKDVWANAYCKHAVVRYGETP